ncbi:MAG: hypothetical protein Kow0075_17450 [Salibacteraceae bacterium]
MNALEEQVESLEVKISEVENTLNHLRTELEGLKKLLAEYKADTGETAPGNREKQAEPQPDAANQSAVDPGSEIKQEDTPSLTAKESSTTPTAEEEKTEKKSGTSAQEAKSWIPESSLAGKTLVEKMSHNRLQDLREGMGINDRFLFANELFDGDISALNRAINELNHIETPELANRLIHEQLAIEYSWDFEDETVKSFISLVERKFGL